MGYFLKLNKKGWLLFLSLFGFWMIVSARIETASLLIGIIFSYLVCLANNDSFRTTSKEKVVSLKVIRMFGMYLLMLVVEVVKSNIEVARIVLSKKMDINPKLVRVETKIKQDFFKVLYGNTITLTPGTLTLDLEEDQYVVHALTDKAAGDLSGSKMEKYIIEIEEAKR